MAPRQTYGIQDVADPLAVGVEKVIPEEESVPSRLLGDDGELHQAIRLRQAVEGRDEQRVAHWLNLSSRRTGPRHARRDSHRTRCR